MTGYGAHEVEERVPVYHVVQKGESLDSISQYYRVSAATLSRLNGIRSSRVLQGQRLLVGYRYEGAEPVSKRASTKKQQGAVKRVSAKTESTFISQGRLGWPINTGYIASTFGPRWGGFHDGLDFAAPRGTPVFSAQAGKVVYSDNEISGYGNLIIVQGDDRLLTVYAHNDALLVEAGERVKKGEKIAEVGASGRAQGNHLHFEVRARDSRGRYVAVDPWPLLTEKHPTTKPRYRVNENLFSIMAKIFKSDPPVSQ